MSKVCAVCGVTFSDTLLFCPSDGTALRSTEQTEDLVGTVIAERYLVTEVLGEGGMGKVYAARHVRLPQQAAIKVLKREMLTDPTAVARFNREAANASRIDHDRVARVYDYGETADGTVYLAMEFVPGKTLKAIIAEEGPLTAARTVELTRQIAEGLDAAHRISLVHRDLKPENVMVVPGPDGSERVKVLDFGIAKAFGESEQSGGTVLTRTGFVVGTPEFMSPEQLLGGALDARSDIYALAIVAYQCLTRDLPFSTNAPDFGMAARLVTPPRPLTAVQPTVAWAREVQAVFDQALSRDPGERHASAGAFARALGAAVDAWEGRTAATLGAGNGVSTSAPTAIAAPPTAPLVGAFAPPAPNATAAAAPMAGALPTVAVASGAAAPAAGVAAPAKGKGGLLAIAAVAVLAIGGGVAYVMRPGPGSNPASAPATAVPNGGTAPAGTPGNGTPNGGTPQKTLARGDGPRNVAIVPNAGTPTSAPNAATTAAPAAATSDDGAEALAAVQRARAMMPDDGATAAQAQAALKLVEPWLPKLASNDDRFEGQMALIEAYAVLEDGQKLCQAYGRARALAQSTPQRNKLAPFAAACPD